MRLASRFDLPCLLTVFALTAAACGDDAGGGGTEQASDGTAATAGATVDDTGATAGSGPGDGPGIEAARALMEPVVRAQCEYLYGCCNADEVAYRLGPAVADPDACTNLVLDRMEAGIGGQNLGIPGLYLDNFLPLFAYGLPSGVAVNDAGFTTCQSEIAALACPMSATDGSTCAPYVQVDVTCAPTDLFTGSGAAGDDCSLYQDIECAPGLSCLQYGPATGVCVDSLGVGAACLSDHECEGDLICDYTTATCAEAAGFGEACAYADSANPVIDTETVRCQQGLRCDPQSETCQPQDCGFGSYCGGDDDRCPQGLSCVAGRCDFLAQAGEQCWDADDCADGTCASGPGGQFCVPLTALGDVCGESQQCASGYCDPNVGECSSQVPPGSACQPGLPTEQCADGYCDGINCIAFAELGDPCPPGECNWVAGHSCLGDTCVEYPYPEGTPCGSGFDCESGSCAGVCLAPAVAGDPCQLASGQCGDAMFCDGAAGAADGTCQPRLGQGAPCTSHSQCWGGCEAVFGQQRCYGLGPGQVACDGT